MRKMLSIIVPVYNGEQYIDRCISSILKTSYKNFEVIAVDDGSTDGSYLKLLEWKTKDSRIKVYKKDNQGVSLARNYGIDKSVGEYIGFVDIDDYISETMFERMIKKMDSHMLVMCNQYIIGEEQTSDEVEIKEGIYKKNDVLKLFFYGGVQGRVCTALFRKKIIYDNHILFENIKLFEDLLFLIDYMCCCEDIYILGTKEYIYDRENENSALNNMGEDKYLEDIIAFPIYLKKIFDKNDYMDGKSILVKEYVVVAMRIYISKNMTFKDFKKIVDNSGLREGLDIKYLKYDNRIFYKLYYLALCKRQYWLCGLYHFLFSAFWRLHR